eukprot:7206970-Pyramimonas_sp.AAC.1
MDHKLELTEEMRNIGDKMIIRDARRQEDEYQLAEQYGAWVVKVEEALLTNEQMGSARLSGARGARQVLACAGCVRSPRLDGRTWDMDQRRNVAYWQQIWFDTSLWW